MSKGRKRVLVACTSGMLILGVFFTTYPFLMSLRPSAKAKNGDLVLVTLPELKKGVVQSVKVEGRPLFVLIPNEEQKESISRLSEHVWNKESNAYKESMNAYVYWGMSTKLGCPLEHRPPETSRLKQWKPAAVWLGGYWDPWCEVSYDYAGRAIKSSEYTYNGFAAKYPNLYTPAIFKRHGEAYVVSVWSH